MINNDKYQKTRKFLVFLFAQSFFSKRNIISILFESFLNVQICQLIDISQNCKHCAPAKLQKRAEIRHLEIDIKYF